MKKYLFVMLITIGLVLLLIPACPHGPDKPGKKDATVDISLIQGVTVPMALVSAGGSSITSTGQFTGSIVWEPALTGGKFEANTQYKARITLAAAQGFTFNGVSYNFFKVEDAESSVNGANSGIVTAYYPETEGTTIYIGEIKGIMPIAGASPVTKISYPQYDINISWWPDPGAAFTVGETYTAVITFDLLDGLDLDISGASIEGAVFTSPDFLDESISVIFDATIAGDPISSITADVTSVTQPTTFSAETSKLTIDFGKDPGPITAGHILILDDTGSAIKGALTGSGNTRVLEINNVATGLIDIVVYYPGVASDPVSVAVYGEQDLRDILDAMTRSQKAGQFIMPAANNGFTTMAANEWGMYLFGGGGYAGNRTPTSWTAAMQNVYTAASPRYLVNGVSTRVPIVWGMDAVHGGLCNNTNNMVAPHNIGLGAIARADLAAGYQASYDAGAMTASELNFCNVNLGFNPFTNICENARFGRMYEAHSFDPNISGQMVLGHVRGMQDNGVAACMKHMMGEGLLYMNNPDQQDGTAYIGTLSYSAFIDTMGAYRAGIEAWSIMPCFNGMWIDVGGVASGGGPRPDTASRGRMHSHKQIINDYWKEELGWTGAVVGDYEGHKRHGVTLLESVWAGNDCLMVGLPADRTSITDSASISDARLNEGAMRMLRLKKRLGLFTKALPFTSGTVRTPALIARNREIAADTMVLLRNKNNLIQRIQAREFKNIYVIGQASDGNMGRGYQCGGWTVAWQGTQAGAAVLPATTMFEGIDGAKGSDITVSTGGATAAITGTQDLIIAIISESSYSETSGNLPANIGGRGCIAPADMTSLTRAYDYQASNPGVPLLVVSLTGRPIAFSTVIGSGDNRIRETLGTEYLKWDGFISAWLPGTEGGLALADLLFTSREFFGKTPFPWFQGIHLAGPMYPFTSGHTTVTNPATSNTPAHANIKMIDAMPIGGSGPWYGVGDLVYSVGYGLKKSDLIDTDMTTP